MTQLFSIIIPVYNVEQFLATCIDSVMKQSYRDFEILLIDDGSTDGSGAICDTYAERYECCRVFHRKNSGLSASRNVGLSMAEGKYVIFLDADDSIEKETLSKLYEQMEIQQYDICSFAARRIDEAGRVLYELRFDGMIKELSLDDENRDTFLLKHFLQYQTGWEVCFHAFRRDIIEREHIHFEENLAYAEDLLFTFEYLLHVERWIKIPDILYNYTLRSGSITKELDKQEMVEGIMYHVFMRISEKLRKKDSKRYSENNINCFYASLLHYFYPRFAHRNGLEGVREMLMDPGISSFQRQQLKIAATQKKKFQEIFGWEEGFVLHNQVLYFLDGNIKRFEKRTAKMEREREKGVKKDENSGCK